MDAVVHGRLTTAVAVLVVGNAAGHVLRPFTPGAGVARPALFVALVLLTGAWRGWAARALHDDLHGRPTDGRAARVSALVYAGGAVAAALLGFVVIHGAPFR